MKWCGVKTTTFKIFRCNDESVDSLFVFARANLLRSLERFAKVGLFNKAPKYYPLTLADGSSMNIVLNSSLPESFVFEEFVLRDELPLEWKVFDWYPDFIDNMTNQMSVINYIDIAQGVSPTYYIAAPIRISNSRLKLVNTDGVGILSEDALCFFWESRNRFNILVLAHTGTQQITVTDHFEFVSVNEGAICRRSPAPEMIENEQWTFRPSLNNYGKRNKESLSLFFTLQLLQNKYLN